jgi:predicted Zn-dependent peptidase
MPEPVPEPVQPRRRDPRIALEYAGLQQSKQLLLLRSAVPGSPEEMCALHVAVNLWGGGPHSRLFREVREKRSLAYYVAASSDAQKGAVLVQAGLDAAAAATVRAEAMRQLAAIAAGEFADTELRTAVATIAGPMRSMDDSLAASMQFVSEQWLRGFDETLAQRIDRYRAVTREAVAAQAAAIWLDFDYLLRPEVQAG